MDLAVDSHNMQGTQKFADSSANDSGTTQLKHNPVVRRSAVNDLCDKPSLPVVFRKQRAATSEARGLNCY